LPPGILTDSGCGRNTSSASSAGWVAELKVPVHYGKEVTGFAQDDIGVDVARSAALTSGGQRR
jgi:hypothetical protein